MLTVFLIFSSMTLTLDTYTSDNPLVRDDSVQSTVGLSIYAPARVEYHDCMSTMTL